MRTIQGIPNIPKETDLVKFPDSTIQNQTSTVAGTPVVREIYGDFLTNLYAFIRSRKIVFNQLEDNELNGYQLIEALKRNVNTLNDVEKILQLNGTIFSLDLDLDLISDKYICFARSSENYDPLQTYQFKGTGDDTYDFSSTGFSTGDELMIVIDFSGVRAYSLSGNSGSGSNPNGLFTPLGNPLSYQSTTDRIWYQEAGKLFNSDPQVHDILQRIKVFTTNDFLIVTDMMMINNFLFVVVLDINQNIYSFFKIANTGFTVITELDCIGFTPNNEDNEDYQMFCYFDSGSLFLTNGANSTSDNNFIIKASIDFNTDTISLTQEITLHTSFQKTTNCVVNNAFFSLINGNLIRTRFDGTPVQILFNFPSFNGLLFKVKGDPYWTNGDVAQKWILNA